MDQALQLLEMATSRGMNGDDLHAAIRNDKLLNKNTKQHLFGTLFVKPTVGVDGAEEVSTPCIYIYIYIHIYTYIYSYTCIYTNACMNTFICIGVRHAVRKL